MPWLWLEIEGQQIIKSSEPAIHRLILFIEKNNETLVQKKIRSTSESPSLMQEEIFQIL